MSKKPKDIKLALIMKASGKHTTPEIAARFGVSKPTLLRALAKERCNINIDIGHAV